ncbi:hypothetical protein C1Y18_18385 [Pseudomonas sp. MPR-R5A]|nr:hypothetical protein C1Y18_18385 [Pseudomonas sp. MPR-R5A]PNA65559.1 hypothetical protein C1Y14_23220 [Pseudomonas sp. MPR-R5B]
MPGFGAASQPNAGQARSPQQSRLPQQASSPQQGRSPQECGRLEWLMRGYKPGTSFTFLTGAWASPMFALLAPAP